MGTCLEGRISVHNVSQMLCTSLPKSARKATGDFSKCIFIIVFSPSGGNLRLLKADDSNLSVAKHSRVVSYQSYTFSGPGQRQSPQTPKIGPQMQPQSHSSLCTDLKWRGMSNRTRPKPALEHSHFVGHMPCDTRIPQHLPSLEKSPTCRE